MGTTSSSSPSASRLDIVFDGTWVFAPAVDGTGKITGVDVYSPSCGHPHGAYFTNQTNLTIPQWPQPQAFYMLDDHGHVLVIESSSGSAGVNISTVANSAINHSVKKRRPLGNNWDLMISINAAPDGWVSSDTVSPTATSGNQPVPCLAGDDAPTGNVSSLQTLSFTNVTNLQLCGAPAKVQGLFPAPWSGGGTLIFAGEIPYFPTLQHERAAIAAVATLAGLDLMLNYPLPTSAGASQPAGRPTNHTGGPCGYALIVQP